MTSSQQSSTASAVRRTFAVCGVATAVALALSSPFFSHESQAQQIVAQAQADAPPIKSTPPQANAPVLAKGLPDFTELVDKVAPSVVSIRTTQRVTAASNNQNSAAEAQMREFLRRFFGADIPEPPQAPQGPQGKAPGKGEGVERPRGLGSGFIVSADGYVLTNAHVVEGADEVYVNLTDKREFKAKVIGVDELTDVAVVKIEAAKLPALPIGDVGKLKVGEWVVAIGSPFGLDNTVTSGIVSGKGRDTGQEIRFLQTDVAVNPGNSGGPLINMRGEVVGINSWILSRSGGFMGISMSIPIDDAMRIAEQLRTGGKVVRGFLGVGLDRVTKEVAESLNLGKTEGVMVTQVHKDTPADKAGLRAGDIITKFAGQAVETPQELRRLVVATKPGAKTTVQIFRNGAYKDVAVTVAELNPKEEGDEPADTKKGQDKQQASAVLGLKLADLTAQQKRELRQEGGVLVEAATGPAAAAGLRPGDIVLGLGNMQIDSVKTFEAVLARLDKTRPVTVLVRRGEWAQYVIIRPAAK